MRRQEEELPVDRTEFVPLGLLPIEVIRSPFVTAPRSFMRLPSLHVSWSARNFNFGLQIYQPPASQLHC